MGKNRPENWSETAEMSEGEVKQERLIKSREGLVKALKPFGCVVVLGCLMLMLVFCFSSGKEPVEGYAPPHSREYYAENLPELVTELEENLLPHLEGVVSCRVSGETVEIIIEHESFIATRAAVLRYYEQDLFTFVDKE